MVMRNQMSVGVKYIRFRRLLALLNFLMIFSFTPSISVAAELSAFSDGGKETRVIGMSHPGNVAATFRCVAIYGNIELRVPSSGFVSNCRGDRVKIESEITDSEEEVYTEFRYEVKNVGDIPAVGGGELMVVGFPTITQAIQLSPGSRCSVRYEPEVNIGEQRHDRIPAPFLILSEGDGDGRITIKSAFSDLNNRGYLRDDKDNKILFNILKNGNDTAWAPSLPGWQGENNGTYTLNVTHIPAEPGNYTGYLNVMLNCL